MNTVLNSACGGCTTLAAARRDFAPTTSDINLLIEFEDVSPGFARRFFARSRISCSICSTGRSRSYSAPGSEIHILQEATDASKELLYGAAIGKLLRDALEAANEIGSFTAGASQDVYLQDRGLQLIVERLLLIAGEALGQAIRLDASIVETIPDARVIVGTRDRIVHGYERSTTNWCGTSSKTN